MDRRTFNKLAGLTALAALTENAEMSAAQAAAVSGEVAFWRTPSSSLPSIPPPAPSPAWSTKPTHWTIERRPALGISFRLLAPLPHQRANFILGQKQLRQKRGKSFSETRSRSSGRIRSASTAASSRSRLRPRLRSKTAPHLRWHPRKQIFTFPIETIDYPYFGDLNPPTPDSPHARSSTCGSARCRVTKSIRTFRIPEEPVTGASSIPPSPSTPIPPFRPSSASSSPPSKAFTSACTIPRCAIFCSSPSSNIPASSTGMTTQCPRTDEISNLPVHLEFRTCPFHLRSPAFRGQPCARRPAPL